MKIGEKVECIDDKCQLGTPPFAEKGKIYTISAIVHCSVYGIGVQLAELNMQPDDYLFAERFYLIIDRSLEDDGVEPPPFKLTLEPRY
jgi:hypothetical protein